MSGQWHPTNHLREKPQNFNRIFNKQKHKKKKSKINIKIETK